MGGLSLGGEAGLDACLREKQKGEGLLHNEAFSVRNCAGCMGAVSRSLLFLLQQTIEVGKAGMPIFIVNFAKLDRSVLRSIFIGRH